MESLRELRWPDLLGPRPCCWQRWGGLCRGRVSRDARAEVPSKINPIINRLHFRKDKDRPVLPKPLCSPAAFLRRDLQTQSEAIGQPSGTGFRCCPIQLKCRGRRSRNQEGSLSQNCTLG